MKLQKIFFQLSLAIAVLLISACATTQQSNTGNSNESVASSEKATARYEDKDLNKIAAYKIDSEKSNSAPTRSFDHYGDFVLKNIILSSENKDSNGAKRGQVAMDSELEYAVGPLLESWKKEGPTLLIQPEITSLRMISGTARFWAGAFAGGSHVTLKLTLIDEATGEEVATPEFFRKSNAYGAAWSGGAADRDIYRRAAKLAQFYFLENLKEAVPTPSGRE